MIYYFFAFVLVACIGCLGYLAGKVKQLEYTLIEENSSLAKEVVSLRKRLEEFGERLKELDEEMPEKDYEKQIAEEIEKRWNDGLQSIIDFNPSVKQEGDGK